MDRGAADVLAPDLWSDAGLARSAAVDLDGSSFQDVFTEAELAALGGAVGDRFAMSFDATSSCAEPLELGFSGGGGWLKATVAPGSGTSTSSTGTRRTLFRRASSCRIEASSTSLSISTRRRAWNAARLATPSPM